MFVIRIRLKRALAFLGSAAAVCAVAGGVYMAQRAVRRANTLPSQPPPLILVDAGHGGEDGGAVGLEGIIEKELNLPIALKLEAFLRAMGYETLLTRDTDASIHDAQASTLRERKTSDIHNRFHMMESLRPTDLFVSIHQNKFPQSGPHGTQVFYSSNHPQSRMLALAVQQNVVALLQPENERKVKPSGEEIYLLYHAEIPAVLVECGFISNPDDAAKLIKEEYQNQMAFAIACGILEYCSE
jgi:N-acetylmuramoyl-L-alanine amidase